MVNEASKPEVKESIPETEPVKVEEEVRDQPAEPVESMKSAEPIETPKSTEPIEITKSVESILSVKSVKSVRSVKSTKFAVAPTVSGADEPNPLEVEDKKEEELIKVEDESPTTDETMMIGATEETEQYNVREYPIEEEKEEEDENDVENDEEMDSGDELQYKRINTLHAELYVPLSAKSGDYIDIEHDGTKQIKIPKGQQGQSITVRMVKNEVEQSNAGVFCGCF